MHFKYEYNTGCYWHASQNITSMTQANNISSYQITEFIEDIIFSITTESRHMRILCLLLGFTDEKIIDSPVQTRASVKQTITTFLQSSFMIVLWNKVVFHVHGPMSSLTHSFNGNCWILLVLYIPTHLIIIFSMYIPRQWKYYWCRSNNCTDWLRKNVYQIPLYFQWFARPFYLSHRNASLLGKACQKCNAS